jgi:monoamine oxidase
VAVVGAGFAGLAAAEALVQAGRDVVVLEARDRVGGRVWSRTLPGGQVVEMGAEFILPGNTVVEETARRLGLGLWEKGMAYGRREPRGVPVTEAELRDAAAAIERALEDPDLALEPDGAVLSRWADDPWARGAYSVHTPGGNDPALAQRYGVLVLAGEHTAGPYAALMEGALRSGARAAAQLLG